MYCAYESCKAELFKIRFMTNKDSKLSCFGMYRDHVIVRLRLFK